MPSPERNKHIAQAATLASAAYPNWSPTRSTLEVWATLLNDLTGPELVEAMAAHIRHSEFPPTVASLLSRSRSLKASAGESPGILAWAEVHAAIKDGRKLRSPEGARWQWWSSELTEKALQSLGGWVSVADCQTAQVSSMRSRFCEAYDQLAKQLRDDAERVTLKQISTSQDLMLE